MAHSRDTILDSTEAYPSLISCLEAGKHGFCLDIDLPEPKRNTGDGGMVYSGPFSRTIKAKIKTDGGDAVQDVLLVLQKDRYDFTDPMVSISNTDVEIAWQNAFAFHNRLGQAKEGRFFRDQISPKGLLLPFQPLFLCLESKRWFHPMCPECGIGLTLCRDDVLLKKKGLPPYTDSLERFLFCPACAARSRSDAPAFYTYRKTAAMPDFVRDAITLAAQWQQRLDSSKKNYYSPCEGCDALERCYGSDSPGTTRIVPFSFYPFYMLMFPAPACDAVTFMRMLSGANLGQTEKSHAAIPASSQGCFLFRDKRRFLEILYLKLTFLDQVIRQYMPTSDSAPLRDVGLSLDGIGVDLHLPGTGLPAYWNFRARILDAIGSLNHHPFTPAIPEAPYYHFLGAVWFRVLLVNESQTSEAVYAAVGRLVDSHPDVSRLLADDLSLSDPASVFAANNLFHEPDGYAAAQEWQGFWVRAITLGFQLVQAGVKTGTPWNPQVFLSSLDALRNEIKNRMFAEQGAQPAASPPRQTDRIRDILVAILDKWQTASVAIDDQSVTQTVPLAPDSDDLGQTVVISPLESAHGEQPAADAQAWTADGSAEELAATRIIDPGEQPFPSPPLEKNDPDATVIIDPESRESATPPITSEPTDTITDNNDSNEDDIMEQTIIIRSDTHKEK